MSDTATTKAEQGLLGCALVSPALIPDIAEVIVGLEWAEYRHEALWRALCELSQAGADLSDPVYALHSRGKLPDGGVEYIHHLTDSAPPSALSWRSYADRVLDAYRRRVVDVCARTLQQAAKDPAAEVEGVVADHIERLGKLVMPSFSTDTADYHAAEMITDLHLRAQGKAPRGLPTGLTDLDAMLTGRGMHPGQLIVVGGRPGMGKTSMGLGMAMQAISVGVGVGILSLEMSGKELMQRWYAAEQSIPLAKVMGERLDDAELAALTEAASSPLGLSIEARPALSLDQVAAAVRRWQLRGCGETRTPLGLVVVDHLHLIASAPGDRSPLHERIGKVTSRLKALAKQVKCPIALLVQLSREVAKRTDTTPTLTDLRDSGSIEADADVVLFPHRPGYYDDHNSRDGVVVVAKQRNGPTGSVAVGWRPLTAQYVDLAQPLRLRPEDRPGVAK